MRLWFRAFVLACVLVGLLVTIGAGFAWLRGQEQEDPVPVGFEKPVQPVLEPPAALESA